MDLELALEGVKEFFDGEWYTVSGVRDFTDKQPPGDRQPEDYCSAHFDHCYVDQNGGGMTGDDCHGEVYFNISGNRYLVAEY